MLTCAPKHHGSFLLQLAALDEPMREVARHLTTRVDDRLRESLDPSSPLLCTLTVTSWRPVEFLQSFLDELFRCLSFIFEQLKKPSQHARRWTIINDIFDGTAEAN